jgi:hypothetical protein
MDAWFWRLVLKDFGELCILAAVLGVVAGLGIAMATGTLFAIRWLVGVPL